MMLVHSAAALVMGMCLTGLNLSSAQAVEDPKPILPSIGDVPQLTDAYLGLFFVAAGETLAGSTGAVHQAMKQSREEGQELAITVTDVVPLPDGSTDTYTFRDFEELDRYLTKIRLFHTASKAEIMKRGFKRLGSSYTIDVAPDCPKEWLASGMVESDGIEFYFRLRQDAKIFEGVSVRSSVVVVFPSGIHPPLMGKINGKKIRLSATSGKCTMVLSLLN